MNNSPRRITNFVADRMRAAMRIDHPDECAALRMGINEIEWLYKIALHVYGCVGRPLKLADGRMMDLSTEAKARAYDVLSSYLHEETGTGTMLAGPERTLAEMRADDARCAETMHLERFDTPVNILVRDRRQLLERVMSLEAQMLARHSPQEQE